MYDAVNLLTATLPELHTTQPVVTEPLSCDQIKKWEQGLRVAAYMKVVSIQIPL